MKAKIILAAVVVLLILAQFIYGGREGKKAVDTVAAPAAGAAAAPSATADTTAPVGTVAEVRGEAAATTGTALASAPELADHPVPKSAPGSVQESAPKSPQEVAAPVAVQPAATSPEAAPPTALAKSLLSPPEPLFPVQAITSIDLPEDGGQLRINPQGRWVISAPIRELSEPADVAKIRRLLSDLAGAGAVPTVLNAAVGHTGLKDGRALTLTLREGEDGKVHNFRIGLRPEGAYDATYAVLPDGKEVLIPADIRGDLGLFVNRPGAAAPKDFWLDQVVLSFDPAEAVRLVVQYPDHKIVFARNSIGDWQPECPVPGEVWSQSGLAAWLKDLASFRVDGQAGADAGTFPEDAKTCKLIVTLADGSVKTLLAGQSHANSEVQVLTSERPGGVYQLANWRFRKYFRRMEQLFPKATAHYDLSAIRFIDLRRDGESVKMTYRDGEWRGVASPYPVRAARMERLARFLAAWRPEDFAATDFRLVRPSYGGPMLEVILADGEVHQYRLAGRHPFLPWRYVILDGKATFAVSDAAVGVMFPGFAEVLDLGRVFLPITRESVTRIELSDPGKLLATFEKDRDGGWKAKTEAGETRVTPEESRELIDELMDWPILGFYDNGLSQGKPEPAFTLWIWDEGGGKKKLLILPPHEREIPYVTDNGRAFMLDRAEFFNWLGAVRAVSKRILAENGAKEDAGGNAVTNAGERL